MSGLDDYRAAVAAIAPDTAPSIRVLLLAVGEAWADAEQGVPSEAEARRWSPVCDAATVLAMAVGA